MEFDWSWLQLGVVATFFAGCLVRSTFGFGDALLSVPILAILVGDLRYTAPVLGLVSISNCILLLGSDLKNVRFNKVWRMVLGAAIGVPVGITVLVAFPERWALLLLGFLVFAYGVQQIRADLVETADTESSLFEFKSPAWAYFFGCASGCLSGAFNTAGPPAVIYANSQRWPTASFRMTMTGFLLPVNCVLVLGHASAGLWTARVWACYLQVLPTILLAVGLGHVISKRMSESLFRSFLKGALLILGGLLIVKNLWS